MNWKEYENRVLKYFTTKYPNSKIQRNIKLQGRRSKTQREIDILLTTTVFGCSMELAIECKNWTSKLDVADVGVFIDKLNDVGISKGIIISTLGYSEGAHNRARAEMNLQLQVLNFENLEDFYGFWGNPYRGNFGAIISAPNGWVVNNNVSKDYLLNMLCWLHPMEFDLETAIKKGLLMYFQILPIIEDANMNNTFLEQDRNLLQKYANTQIRYWEESNELHTIKFRQINIATKPDVVEFTAGIEIEDFFVYCVYSVPSDYNSDDLARLHYVMNQLHLIKMQGVDPENSHEAWEILLSPLK